MKKDEELFYLELEVQNMLPNNYPHYVIDGKVIKRPAYNEIAYLMLRDKFLEDLG